MPSDEYIIDVNPDELVKIVGEYKEAIKDPATNVDIKTYIFNRSTRWITIQEQ